MQYHWGPGGVEDKERAGDVIRTRMDHSRSLEWWLCEQDVVSGHPATLCKAQMRAYRLRWLDALIEEFEAKGD